MGISTKPERQRDTDDYSEEETIARREAALKRMLTTPWTAHKPAPTGERTKRGRPPKDKSDANRNGDAA